MSNKTKRDSSLVKAVLALDDHLSELERVGARINSTDMTSDIDVEFIQKLMNRFAECGQGVALEVTNLSRELNETQSRAAGVAQGVSAQAELLNLRRNEQNEQLEKFRILGEQVGALNTEMSQFRRPQGQGFSDEDRARLASSVPAFEAQLAHLIEELQDVRKAARESRMRALERNAESLSQTLQAVRTKLSEMTPRQPAI